VPVEELERLVAELRDNVLSIRMMPIGATFSRFKRLVHDLSGELGKEIDLVTEGGETELDKTVLDQLGDPLVHLIRNSLDHGVEPAEIRRRNGKPRHGTIRLAAEHVGSSVIITIGDDGKGLDTEAIRAKAIEKKLISADAVLAEKEIFNLIFLPGFSTASQVTSVSGRGVGLDVVKRQIEALHGAIAVSSWLGKGTCISLSLPLTLAIIEGLLIEIGRDQFIVPMSSVTENVELHRAERMLNNGRNVIAVRGELVPYIRLRELFSESEGELEVEKIVIVQHEGHRVGLVVDRVLGSHQTVIQSLGRFYKNIELVSGATIMGDGRVALIFDLAGLVRYDRRQGERTQHTTK
jgi:two-component system chemotaxis sensor kinase CheA